MDEMTWSRIQDDLELQGWSMNERDELLEKADEIEARWLPGFRH